MKTRFLLASFLIFWFSPVKGADQCDVYSNYENDPVLSVIVSFVGMETQSYQEKRCRLEQEAYALYVSVDELHLINQESDRVYRSKTNTMGSNISATDEHSDDAMSLEIIKGTSKTPKNRVFETGEGFTSSGVLSD